MTTLAWYMIALGLLFWTSSLAERNTKNVNVNEATDDSTIDDRQYHRSDQNDLPASSKVITARIPYQYHQTTAEAIEHLDPSYNLQSSIFPAEDFHSAVLAQQDIEHPQASEAASLHRSIDEDSIVLNEPKNELELETKSAIKGQILNSGHEISEFDFYNRISPTKTKLAKELGDIARSVRVTLSGSGEGGRASSRARSLPLAEPNSATSPDSNATASDKRGYYQQPGARSNAAHRQSNSEIQDIINGFVKLLNGNVQVQMNTNGPAGKPAFPSRTRINNRGPPRITDVPPIVFDPPVQIPANVPQSILSTMTPPLHVIREPPPYPFDIPQLIPTPPVVHPFISGVPLPELLVPTNGTTIANRSESRVDKNVTSNTFAVESVNRSQAKINSSTIPSEPIFVASLSESKVNVSDKNLTQEITPFLHKINASQPTLVKPGPVSNVSSSEIRPTSMLPPLKSSILSGIKPDMISDNSLPVTGVGTAVVVLLEPSTQEVVSASEVNKATASILSTAISGPSVPITSTSMKKRPASSVPNSTNGYFPRPGIVLDDPEYKPGSAYRRPPPIITASTTKSNKGDVFDVTVSAIQGAGGSDNSSKAGHPYVHPVEIDPGLVDAKNNEVQVITNPQSGQNFVSIDGKRTYINLFESSTANTGQVTPTLIKNYPGGSQSSSHSGGPSSVTATKASTSTKSPAAWKKSTHPPVRIDTCIVGDDSTCDSSQHERCRTEAGVSSCHCRPGYTRRKHREPCHRVVSMFLSLRVDRMYDQHLSWNDKLAENDSAEYQQLEYEAGKAIDSALSMTPFSDLFLGVKVNNIYTSRNSNTASPVFVNMTVQLAESVETLRPPVKQDLQKHLMGVIQRRSNNIGSSALWVDNPVGVVSQIHDVDECGHPDLNDCHSAGKCTNVFGSFHCTCPEGYRDPYAGNVHRSGRVCETCDAGHCNRRGDCSYHNGQPVCRCTGSYYGAQCEVDGEVLGVAVGSSLVAIFIIISTLACLCAWSRRWNKEQKIGSPIFGYMPSGGSSVKTPVMGAPPYQVSMEDRIRWAQIADAMAQANHYGPEPVNGPTRPSSTIFGYSLPHSAGPLIMPRLRPPSVHTLRTPESSTSEEEDRADLLGRSFHVPRPKSRSSIANQSGIYYDVDYDSQQQSGEIFSTIKSGQPPCIPLNTYTMGSRSHYFNFRS